MPADTKKRHKSRYKQRRHGKSVFDGSPTLIVNSYKVPNAYSNAVKDVITAFRNGISFNKAVDQVAALYPRSVSRNKLAEHTLKFIANDY